MLEPTPLLAASLLATLSIAAAVLAAALLGAVAAVLATRRRDDPAAPPVGDGSVAGELRAIGAQIEQSLVEQRHQGETQRRLLSQQLEGVRETVETQGHEVGGLRNELRHEVRRRDAELDEIRHQLATIRTGEALPAPPRAALPAHDEVVFEPLDDEPFAVDPVTGGAAGGGAVDPFQGDGSADVSVSEFEHLDVTGVEAPTEVEADAFDIDADDAAAAEGAPPETVGPLSFDGSGGEAGDGAVGAEPAAVSAATFDIFTPISFDAPAEPAPPATAWVSRTDRADVPDAIAPDAFAPDDVLASAFATKGGAAAAVDGAEDLTVIGSIDEATQAFLYRAGVLTLDDVARLGRGEAQRIAHGTGLSEHTVMNEWVLEAQATLFDRFSQEVQP